jgi:hypothetical protein
MKRKEAKLKRRKASETTVSSSARARPSTLETARIWRAADQVISYEKQGLLDRATLTGLCPFIEASIELAAATLVNPKEDPTPLLRSAQLGLERAIQILPSIEDLLDDSPPAADAAKRWQVSLVRDAVRITRSFTRASLPPTVTTTSNEPYEPYATTPASLLEEPDSSRLWLVEHLWQRAGTGIIGGAAKGAKTWLALDLALSIASGTRALDTFPIHHPGAVVYVSAEGGEGYVKQRLNALCVHRGLSLNSLPHRLEVIPRAIRIDTEEGFGRLRATIKALAPTLLVLDPLVRLHRLDENSAASVSGLLSNLTDLQQTHNLAIILIHHARKQGAGSRDMGGQDFRGSSDFYAWGDSNIFVKKKGQSRFVISAEHRAAPATEKWTLQTTKDEHPRLQIVDDAGLEEFDQSREAGNEKMDTGILDLLRHGPRSIEEVRKAVKGSNGRISEAINRLEAGKKIAKAGRLWTITNGHAARAGVV